MRKLATIRKIDNVKAIPEADKICAYQVGGWWVVDAVGKYKINDLVVFCEVDSFVPTALAPFLTKPGHFAKTYSVTNEDGTVTTIEGERLRTVKLRGQLSQGLLLPIPEDTIKGAGSLIADGLDVTDHLGILKWEAPVNAQLAGMARGNFPTAVPKTDQERIQNLTRELQKWTMDETTWEVTEKLDGSSCTFFMDGEGEFHVCSRNLNLKQDEFNTFWKAAVHYNVESTMRTFGLLNVAIQGELIGEGIQGNPYGIKGHEFHCFDIYDVKLGQYMKPNDRRATCEFMKIKHVPVIEKNWRLVENTTKLLSIAEGKSVLNVGTEREGLVFKNNKEHNVSFKAISNKFLLKGGD
jgi:RNA ligase (TIGR02306 family)